MIIKSGKEIKNRIIFCFMQITIFAGIIVDMLSLRPNSIIYRFDYSQILWYL